MKKIPFEIKQYIRRTVDQSSDDEDTIGKPDGTTAFIGDGSAITGILPSNIDGGIDLVVLYNNGII